MNFFEKDSCGWLCSTFALPVPMSKPSKHLVSVSMDGIHPACVDLGARIQRTTRNLQTSKKSTSHEVQARLEHCALNLSGKFTQITHGRITAIDTCKLVIALTKGGGARGF